MKRDLPTIKKLIKKGGLPPHFQVEHRLHLLSSALEDEQGLQLWHI